MAEYKVDIFDVLNRISCGEKDIWEKFSDEERKAISPLIVMRWLSGTGNARQIVYINTLVNHLIFACSKHPDLLFKLMASCTDKRPARYQWIGQKKSVGQKKLCVEVIKQFYNYSNREALSVINLISKDDFIEMAEKLGWDKDAINKLKKEL